ncbi:MAG: protein O-mannosyl-transferase family [Chloroflexota bacterium]
MNSFRGNYRLLNNITGWLMFLVSSTVYLLTVEPTVSFWDCGEFILSAFKLQVGHPPGAPLFLMLGRVATMFAGSDLSRVAVMMNALSAICSGFAIMFLFWTITHLVRKVNGGEKEPAPSRIPAIIGSGIIGAMAYTFTDTFWFSAVEGELYALSSLIIAVVFWGMLRWEEEADEPYSGRWIILIAFIMGLGLGIHRLNLLIIPVFVFVYYFKKYDVTTKGVIKALLLAVLLLWLMVFVLIPGVPEVAGWFELLFVNGFGLPYNTGLFFFIIVLFSGLAYGIYYSLRSNRVILNYALTAFAVIMIGYSSYAMIMIRSSARPPMNQNDPSDVFSLSYYINMKQYGSSPKIFGNYYSAPVVDVKQVIAGYNKVDGKYEPYYHPEYKYDSQFETLFPRMYDSEPDHVEAYKYWGKVTGRKYTYGNETIVAPTFAENMRYFFRYQLGYMYLRYFMWNFAGRQNDIQGNGNPIHGNWISGVTFLDEARLGNLGNMPAELKTNPGRNTYYFLPLILGILGMFWHYRKSRNDFWLVMGFFIMTGAAIILYLNQYPNQPRERDYAYVGSFYAFAIWIGLGFMFVYEKLQKHIGDKASYAVTFIVLLFAAPVLMAVQNWDDHDRSGRYTARDIGANYLKSCAPNAILFTYGDNDSFPVWCVQDVEQVRPDVRVANLSYIQAGWYISMMRQKAFESDPIPLSLPQEKYREGQREQLPVNKRVEKPVPLKDVVAFAGQDDRKYKIDLTGRGDMVNYLPTNKFQVEVDSVKVLQNETVKNYFRDKLNSPMIWEYSEENAFKGDLAIMDMISTNGWVRPVYYSTTVPSSQYKGLEKYFVQEGLAYRLVPVSTGKSEDGEFGMPDPVVMYDNMMNKFTWGNAEDPGVYLDENNRRMFSNFRRLFGVLANDLINSGDTTKALEAARRGLEIVPAGKMPLDYFVIGIARAYLRAGDKEEGTRIINEVINYSKTYLDYALGLGPESRFGMDYPIGINMQSLLDIYNMSVELKIKDISDMIEPEINNYYGKLYSR